VVDKIFCGKVIYITFTIKHPSIKKLGGSGDKAPCNLAVNEGELSASRSGESSVSGRLPTFPLKGMSAV
jgi:hypothetical protein